MTKIKKPKTSQGLAVLCAKAAGERIAKDILILNLSKIDSSPANFFVICTCDSEAQIRAVTEEVIKYCHETGITKPRIEGLTSCQWVLLDMFDVVMHIMLPNIREYYKLEKLWGDAQFLQLNDDGKARIVKNVNNS